MQIYQNLLPAYPDCFKVIYIPKPDCSDPDLGDSDGRRKSNPDGTITLSPNPCQADELTIKSDMAITSIEIYNLSGILIQKIHFSGKEFKWNMANFPTGIYIIKYTDEKGKIHTTKFIKS